MEMVIVVAGNIRTSHLFSNLRMLRVLESYYPVMTWQILSISYFSIEGDIIGTIFNGTPRSSVKSETDFWYDYRPLHRDSNEYFTMCADCLHKDICIKKFYHPSFPAALEKTLADRIDVEANAAELESEGRAARLSADTAFLSWGAQRQCSICNKSHRNLTWVYYDNMLSILIGSNEAAQTVDLPDLFATRTNFSLSSGMFGLTIYSKIHRGVSRSALKAYSRMGFASYFPGNRNHNGSHCVNCIRQHSRELYDMPFEAGR